MVQTKLTSMCLLNLFSIFAAIFLLIACQQSPDKAFEKAKTTGTIEAYEDFIKKYPDSPQVKEAQIALERIHFDNAINSGEGEKIKTVINKFPQSTWVPEIKKQYQNISSAEFEKVMKENTIEAYEAFLQKYWDSPQVKEAQIALERLYFDNAINSGEGEKIKTFINKFPQSTRLPEIKKQYQNISSAEFEKVKKENTIEAYEAFLKKYPDSPRTKEAQIALERIKALKLREIEKLEKKVFDAGFLVAPSYFRMSMVNNLVLERMGRAVSSYTMPECAPQNLLKAHEFIQEVLQTKDLVAGIAAKAYRVKAAIHLVAATCSVASKTTPRAILDLGKEAEKNAAQAIQRSLQLDPYQQHGEFMANSFFELQRGTMKASGSGKLCLLLMFFTSNLPK